MTLHVPDWEPPWPVSGSPSFIRVTSRMTRGTGCAEQTARKARPDLYPRERAPKVPFPPGDFPLGLVRDAALLLATSLSHSASEAEPAVLVRAAVEQAVAASRAQWSPDVLPAVESGLVGYLEVLESLRASGDLPDGMVFANLVSVENDGEPADRLEFWAWGIHHISRDGALREVHLLRWQRASQVVLDDVEAAFIAHVTASGDIADADAPWAKPFRPSRSLAQPPAADSVRVRIIGLLDATSDLRFAGSAQQAHEAFLSLVPSSLGVLAGGAMRPSRACTACNVRYVCPGIPHLPGLLGVTGFSPYIRALSPSDLWTHRVCPRQLHLAKDLGLPKARREDSPALSRGVQVHAWLAEAHQRGVACSDADLAPDSVLLEGLGWSHDERASNLPYLRQHLSVCPLRDTGVTEVQGEVDITVWDTDANVVFSTRPDSAYRSADGRWVLRETKTLSPRQLPEDPRDLLTRYPQVAAAICLLADGYRGYEPGGELASRSAGRAEGDDQTLDDRDAGGVSADPPGWVELELLGPEASALLSYDAGDARTVLLARTALADRIDAWLFDEVHPIGERPPCATCDVAQWCDRRPEGALEAAVEGLSVVSVAGVADWDIHAPEVVLRDLMGTVGDDEEFPF